MMPRYRMKPYLVASGKTGPAFMITLQEIRLRVNRIAGEAIRGDHDAAHSAEDRLFVDVLTAIAAGKAGRAEAEAALRSRELMFVRRTA